MQKNKLKLNFFVSVLAVFAIAGFVFVATKTKPTSAVTSICTTYHLVIDNAAATAGTPLHDVHQLGVYAASSTAVKSVVFTLNDTAMGRGVLSGSTWSMPWYTQATPSANYSLGAKVLLSTGESCAITPVAITTNNPTVSPLVVLATPASVSTNVNTSANFVLSSRIAPAYPSTSATVDVTAYTVFQKAAPAVGTLTTLDNTENITYASGGTPGTGVIETGVFYGGANKHVSIPVRVLSTTTPSGTTTPKDTNTTAAPGASTAPVAAAASPTSVESDPAKACAVASLTAARYQAINSGSSRPTAAEFEAINKCFATRKYVLSTNFVPVAPDKVSKLPAAKEIKIAGATNQTKKVSSKDVTTLKFAGKAKAGSLVLLYVHSEPLVLSTTADKNGDWNYVLDDPLEAGNHEAYAVVNKGDGTYQRSSVFDFAIARAGASAVNPKGNGLKIQSITPTATVNNRSSTVYIAASVGLVVLVLAVLAVVLSIRYKRRLAATDAMHPETTITPSSEQPMSDSVQEPSATPTESAVADTPETTEDLEATSTVEETSIVETPETPKEADTLDTTESDSSESPESPETPQTTSVPEEDTAGDEPDKRRDV